MENSIIPATKKSPILSAVLSILFLGGGGQMYLGQWKKGLVMILIIGYLLSQAGFLIIFILPFCAADAYGLAKKMSNGNPIGELEWAKDTSYIPAANKSPILSVILNVLFLGGGGYIYLGQWKKALLTILMSSVFLLAGSSAFLLAVGFFLIFFLPLNAADAYGLAKKMSDGEPIREWDIEISPKLVGPILLIYLIIGVVGLMLFMIGGNGQ